MSLLAHCEIYEMFLYRSTVYNLLANEHFAVYLLFSSFEGENVGRKTAIQTKAIFFKKYM